MAIRNRLKNLVKRKKKPKVIAKLNADELRRVMEQRRLLADSEMQTSMMRCSYRVLWRALQEKYELPEDVDLEDATGKLFKKDGASG